MAKNRMIAEMGVDEANRMPNAMTAMMEKSIQAEMGFGAIEENMHSKSSMMKLPEHPRKES
jgi:hypothetical protein